LIEKAVSRALAVCGSSNAIELWDLGNSGIAAAMLDGHTGHVLDIAILLTENP
jgi:hypothetical protein